MPFYYISKKADLTVLPKIPAYGFGMQEYTIGDLHGNALKFIYILICMRVITNVDSELYENFRANYTDEALSALDIINRIEIRKDDSVRAELAEKATININNFRALLQKIKFRPGIKLRIMGDDVNDRGQCDFYTLLIYNALRNAGVDYDIMLSNHSVEFLYNFEQNVAYDTKRLLSHDLSKGCDFYKSSRVTQALIDYSVISREEVDNLVLNAYLPSLKLIAYKKEDNIVSFYTHAPAGKHLISSMLSSFTSQSLHSIENIMAAIDDINQRIHERKISITELWNSPFLHQFLWNTDEALYQDRQTDMFADHLTFFVHGHFDPPQEHITVDNDLGKAIDANVGELILLGYDESVVSLALDDGHIERVVVCPDHQYVLPSRDHLAVPSCVHSNVDESAWSRVTTDGLLEISQNLEVYKAPVAGIGAVTLASSSSALFAPQIVTTKPLLAYLREYFASEEALQQIKFITEINDELARVDSDISLIDGVLKKTLFVNPDYFNGLLMACESAFESGVEPCQRGAEQILRHNGSLLLDFKCRAH